MSVGASANRHQTADATKASLVGTAWQDRSLGAHEFSPKEAEQKMRRRSFASTKAARLFGVLAPVAIAGCVSSVLDVDDKSIQPIPAKVVADMGKKNMSSVSPILIRILKDESELEIWKADQSGRYALLKIYPMCRWSGKLGPKTRNGDRQAPEGFYSVSAGMLNPNSQYYLAFNLGYPNRLESALGYSGEALMVHGACSSSGCFALTDEGVAEIYSIARDALKGGQSAFQVQAFPFRMTQQNMAKNRNDPNFAFWSNIKQGYDIFELTRRPPEVGYCGGHYTFDAVYEKGEPRGPLAPCPPLLNLEEPAVVAKREADREPALSGGAALSVHAYSDGGMHASFRKLLERYGAEALSKKTSLTAVPISRPDAALADPHDPKE
jgi:murein L,D-transpeptidase YafK